jgi:hypothetical protein
MPESHNSVNDQPMPILSKPPHKEHRATKALVHSLCCQWLSCRSIKLLCCCKLWITSSFLLLFANFHAYRHLFRCGGGCSRNHGLWALVNLHQYRVLNSNDNVRGIKAACHQILAILLTPASPICLHWIFWKFQSWRRRCPYFIDNCISQVRLPLWGGEPILIKFDMITMCSCRSIQGQRRSDHSRSIDENVNELCWHECHSQEFRQRQNLSRHYVCARIS